MSYLEDFGLLKPNSSSPLIGSPNLSGYFDGAAQSYRSNQFRPPSPPNQRQSTKQSDGPPLLKRHNIDFLPEESITHLASGRNQVVLATRDKKVLVIDTASNKETDCDLVRYLGNRLMLARIHKLFVDPTGRFTLISLAFASDNQPMENLLFVKRVQPLPRLKNYLISAVAWNYPKPSSSASGTDLNSNSTGTILLGTTKGVVLQAEFIHTDESKFFPLSTGPKQYVKEIFDMGLEGTAITGLEYHQITSTNPAEKSFIIMICTNSRLYRMVGSVPANIEPAPLHLIVAQNSNNYQDVPGRLNNAKLDFYYPSPNTPPTRFAWLTEPGVLTGEIQNTYNACKLAIESNEDTTLVPYNIADKSDTLQLLTSSTPSGISPPFNNMSSYHYDRPLSVVVTNFHVIVLFRYSIKAICILNEITVYEEYFSTKHGNVQGMCKDPTKNIIWVYFERAVFRYKVINENKNIWKIYLEQKNFELAKKFSCNDAANYDRVICEEAQHYFNSKEYEKSAEMFAKSRKLFEDVSLMFMEIKNIGALKKYLLIRLEQFDPIQVTQITMILGWLFELIISSISLLKTSQKFTDSQHEQIDALYLELDHLLANEQVIYCLKRYPNLYYGIADNYSDSDTFVKVAKLIEDHEHVVEYYMNLGEYTQALDTMKIVKKNELFYTHGHLLMKMMPREFIDALIEQRTIDPSKMISVLIQENPYFNKCSETIRYFEFCVRELKTESRLIHNYLFDLIARYKDESTLLEYLETELNCDSDSTLTTTSTTTTTATRNKDDCKLDLQLCLRLCTELKLTKTCVALYSAMELYDEALNLALTFDVELAKSIARKVESEDHQKRLWLSIAENILTKNLDIRIATDLLRECKLLKIEDILHFFPDYTTIDFFKEAIRKSLQEYKNQIMVLKDGTYDNIANEIRSEIKIFRNRYSIIKIGQRCEICSRNLLAKSFYVFPCGHLFHTDCIIKEITGIDSRFRDNLSRLEQLVSQECVYCGSLLASNIDKPPPIESDDDSY